MMTKIPYDTTALPAEFAGAPVREPEPATDNQLKYLRDLAERRDIPEDARASLLARIEQRNISKRRASEFIERLLDKPRRPQDGRASGEVPSPEQLPAGRYAIENQDGELRFYHLWRGTRRPEFIKLYVEHGSDDSEVPFKSALSILAKIIEAGPLDCARRYGHEIGACSSCGRRLTNRLSRELGIGPVCGGRFYAETDDSWTGIKEQARETIRARGEDPNETIED